MFADMRILKKRQVAPHRQVVDQSIQHSMGALQAQTIKHRNLAGCVVLRQRVEEEIRRYLDLDAWDHAVGIEAAEVESMRTFLVDWNNKSRPASEYPGSAE